MSVADAAAMLYLMYVVSVAQRSSAESFRSIEIGGKAERAQSHGCATVAARRRCRDLLHAAGPLTRTHLGPVSHDPERGRISLVRRPESRSGRERVLPVPNDDDDDDGLPFFPHVAVNKVKREKPSAR